MFYFFIIAVPAVERFDPRIDIFGDWRVVGGSNAPNGAYPFIVSVRSAAGSHFCGGSILNSLNVLTAAHCVIGRTTTNTGVLAGTNTLNSGGITRGSTSLIVHASYNQNTLANDIAVIRLSSALTIGGAVAQVSLNTAATGAVPSVLIGWGRTCTDCGIPNNLQHLNTQTLTNTVCQISWGALVTASQICALTQTGQGSCNGDSGGPLILSSNSAQIGIVSFGYANECAVGWPDVYARVSYYINWITDAVYS
ncbi:chymotrypsin-related [Holotrichia oblita]|uniref:Chymotrypsin-related n=1 Tax=Holotrichia oblita TaxID=644536 RepID=A0ACB9TSC2_HOLOL|nr:chymotrypsin-related [Holotrichia oblita]